MTKMINCLWFDRGEAREAAQFYASVFPDSHVGKAHTSAMDIPSAKVGEDLTVEFTVLGQAYIGLNGGPNFKPNEAVSFMVLTDNQEETDRYWNAIVGNGGQESACGWCKDRWGFSWQITPRVLLDATTDPDRAAAKRAMEAMMTMRKIDIATIEAAPGAKAEEKDRRLYRELELGFCNPTLRPVRIGNLETFSSLFRLGKWSQEHRLMPGIIDFPKVVQDAVATYGDLFHNECQRRHFAEYLTGLMVAQRKTVLGINHEFAETTDQSCLNRYLTDAQWEVQALNQRRLDELQKDPSTCYSDQGVIPIDNTLVDRDGLLIPDAGWFWDHAEERNKIAQDYLFVDYVCTSGKHYPLEFRLFRKEEICEALKEPFRNHTVLCCELVDWVCEQKIPGTFAIDSYFRNAPVLNHIDQKKDHFGQPRGYVGDLKFNRKLEWKGKIIKASDQAASIAPSDRKEMRLGDKRQWYFTATMRIPDVKHKVRIVFLWRYRNDVEPCKILVTNRITWEVTRIVRGYRHRWTGTETFHRDGKQQLGLGDCQLRDVQGQTRHMYLVMLAYSLLMSQLRQGRACEWALHRLTTIGEACRAMLRENLRTTLAWVIEQVTEKEWSFDHVVAHLGLS